MSEEFDPTQGGYISDEEREADRVAQAQLNQEKRAREAGEFWQWVFSQEVGRREMFAILNHLHAFEQPFAVGPNGFPQPEATWARLGSMAAGQALYHKWLKENPPAVMQMYLEGVSQ